MSKFLTVQYMFNYVSKRMSQYTFAKWIIFFFMFFISFIFQLPVVSEKRKQIPLWQICCSRWFLSSLRSFSLFPFSLPPAPGSGSAPAQKYPDAPKIKEQPESCLHASTLTRQTPICVERFLPLKPSSNALSIQYQVGRR